MVIEDIFIWRKKKENVRAMFEWMFVDVYLCANAWYLWLFLSSLSLLIFSLYLSVFMCMCFRKCCVCILDSTSSSYYIRFFFFASVQFSSSSSSHFHSLSTDVLVAHWIFLSVERKEKKKNQSNNSFGQTESFNCVTKTWLLNTHSGVVYGWMPTRN